VTESLDQLALAAGAGDREAFDALVRRTHIDVWRFCAFFIDRQSADDLSQETYLRVHRALPRYRADAPIRSWLLTIARRVCVGEIDRRARAQELSLQLVRTVTPQPVDLAGKVDIDLLIAGLDAERRVAFVLTQVIGCDYAEAAEICRCPIGTIRSRVARARQDLIARLSDSDRTLAGRQGSVDA
jgi:RNA polymerase sigma-70 factor (ECF subfamily)